MILDRDPPSIHRRSPAPLVAVFAVAIAGCAGVDTALDESAPVEADEPVAEAEEALDGRIRYQSECTPFNAALLERSMQYARTVVSTPAFEQCVRTTMAAQYINCDDPNQGLPLATQIDRAMQIVRFADNNMTFACTDGDGDASANYQGYGTTGEHGVFVQNANDADYPDWTTLYGVAPGTADDYMPWNFRAGTMVHEFMHTHDYKHMDPWCHGEDGCDNPQCAWTSHCGGSGTPPASVTSIATAGAAAQEYCSYRRFGDDEWYYALGEPSLPYIMGACAGRIVEESHEACGKATAAGACSDWSALRLLSSWTGKDSAEQSDTAACGCYEDPRKTVALRANTDWPVTAVNGGGAQTRTNWSTLTGSWQWFTLIDQDGNGALNDSDGVQLKTHNGQWLQGDYQSSTFTPAVNRIFRVGGPGVIGAGTQVKLGNFWFNPATATHEWRYAFAGPTLLTASSTASSAANIFTIERPRRDTLIHLRASSGYYLRINGTGGPMMAWSNLLSNVVIEGTPQQQAESAFWLVDHNGGNLVSGDTVSFETLYNDAYAYLSVEGVGTGQVRTVSGIGPTSRFVVTKTGGGTINHNDTITVRSSTGNLLTASLPSAGGQLTNSGSTSAVTSAQRFVLRHVAQHDKARPTW